jgi:uncharacterized repeat protein (TIGR01451 family)
MMHSSGFRILLIAGLAGMAFLPLADAGIFRTAQQTREPPLVQPPGTGMPQPVPVVPGPARPVPVVPPPAVVLPPAIEVPCPPVDPPTPVVKIKVRVPACAVAGAELEYHITVENCSPAPAHHVLVRNPLPANAKFVRARPEPSGQDPDLVWAIGTLAPGECREICLVLLPTDACEIKNCARVQFEHGQCVLTRIASASPLTEPPIREKTPPTKEPPKVIAGDTTLKVEISGPKKQYANLAGKYQITVTNTGSKIVENVLVSAFLPAKSELVSTSDNGRHHFGVIAWLIGNLPPNGSRTVQLSYKVPEAGEYCLKATASGISEGSGEATFCTTFEGMSALHLNTTDSRDPVELGGQMTYRIALHNQGSAPLTNIRVEAKVPPQMATTLAKGPTSAPDKLPAAGADGQLVAFAPLEELKPGETLVYEILVKAVKAGDARLRVTLTAAELSVGGPVIEEESTLVFREDDPFRPVKRKK